MTGRRLRRRAGWLLVAVGGLLVATVAWLLVTGLMARHELTAMKHELRGLRAAISSGDLSRAKVIAADLAHHAHRAHVLTTGPAWSVAAQLPAVGEPLRTARGVSATADVLGSVTIPELVDISGALDPAQLQLKNHQVDIGALIQVTPRLTSVVADLHRRQLALAALPHNTWLGSLNTGARQVDASLRSLVGSLESVDQVARAAPTLLGYSVPQRYFLAFQNEGESRGTGGLPGAFAIIVADHGRLTFTHFGNDGELVGIDSGLDFGPAYTQNWANFQPTKQYLNSNVDPDFRYAAQIWAAMWQKRSGEHVNGALAIDPSALAYFLAVTGPATLADGTPISARNIVSLTQSTVYKKFTDKVKRKAYLLEIAAAAEKRILSGTGNAKEFYRAAAKAAGQRRVLLWTENQAVESFLSTTSVGGAIPVTDAPYAQAVTVNYGANKLDYYLNTAVNWESAGCGPTRTVTVTITLTNNAPAGLSGYVAQRTDRPDYPVVRGDNRILLYYVGTHGGGLEGITIGGRAGAVQAGSTGNHPTYATLVELPRGKTQTVILTLREPATSSAPVVMPHQPRVRSVKYSTKSATCG